MAKHINFKQELASNFLQLVKGIFAIVIILFPLVNEAQTTMDRQIDFVVINKTIDEALTDLSEKHNIEIAYSSNFFADEQKISISAKSQPIQDIISMILKDTQVESKILGERILLVRKKIKKYTYSGYLEDKSTGERLISATIYCPLSEKGTITNEYGFFSLTLPEGSHSLDINYLGYQEKHQQLLLQKNVFEVTSLSTSNTLSKITVVPESQNIELVSFEQPGSIEISPSLVQASPGLGGEEDPVRTIQLLPGVQSGSDGIGGIHVRGGNSGHNLLLLDGVPVYIPYHLLGTYSIYNSNTIRSAKLLKGSFPARYGGRLSSVFDVRTREGNQYNWSANATINLTNAKLLVEGPLKKEKSSILLAGRFAHSSFLLNPFFERTYFNISKNNLESIFYDFNIKWNYILSKNDRLYLSIYNGKDVFGGENNFEEENVEEGFEVELNWWNTIGALRWNHLFSQKLFANTTVTYSQYGYQYSTLNSFDENMDNEPEELYFIDSRTQNRDIGLKVDFDYYPNSSHAIRMGLGSAVRNFRPNFSYYDSDDFELSTLDSFNINSIEELIVSDQFKATEVYAYLEDNISFNEKWDLNLGLRASTFVTEYRLSLNLEPRLNISYHVSPNVTLFCAGSQMTQYLHLISNTALPLPNDLWIPSSDLIAPQKSWQAEFGWSYKFKKGLSLSGNLYYKWMKNLYTLPTDLDFIIGVNDQNIQEFLFRGDGTAYGIELAANYFTPKNGLVFSYTIANSTRKFKDINLGNTFADTYDHRHQIKLFAFQKILPNLQVGANWVFNSSAPRLTINKVEQGTGLTIIDIDPPGQKNKTRGVPYHRFDINLNYSLETGKIKHRFKIGAYNTYNQKNITYYQYENTNAPSNPVRAIPFIPSISYSLSF